MRKQKVQRISLPWLEKFSFFLVGFVQTFMESFSPLGVALQPEPNLRSASPLILLFCDWSVGRDNLEENKIEIINHLGTVMRYLLRNFNVCKEI